MKGAFLQNEEPNDFIVLAPNNAFQHVLGLRFVGAPETQYIDLAKPKIGAPWLFIVTACRVTENKRFRIVRVLMFPVAALIIKSLSFFDIA